MSDQLADIRMYIYKCKYYSGYTPQCYKRSVSSNGFHLNMGCNGDCTRMKNYCKKYMVSKEMLDKAVKTLM